MSARLFLLPAFPLPRPVVHDEFSYLLAGDTLAHGRLSNPVPAYWQHFETEYELLRPSYASQYQPGQGLFLALGQILAGRPWWGVWFSTGLMFATICWALASLLPIRWALFGSILAALQFGIFGFWMNSYFGGSVPAIGGALIFGSLGRLHRRSVADARLAVLCGLGLCLGLATRPVEALIWAIAVTWFQVQSRKAKRLPALPLLLTVGVGLGTLAYYNFRVTGNPAELPYVTYRQTYGTPQSYWWQAPIIVSHFDYPQLADNYQDQLRYWQRRYSASELWSATWRRARDFWRFFAGPLLTPALLFFAVARKRKYLRPWLWLSAVFIVDHATYHAWYPQQSASETVLIVLLLVEGWRHLRAWRRKQRFGPALSRNIAMAFGAAIVVLGIGLYTRPSFSGAQKVISALVSAPRPRDIAIDRLWNVPGKHLVFVHYGPKHNWYDEWVFNVADIRKARIVFARMWTPSSDLALARSLSDRDIWLAEPETENPLRRIGPTELIALWNGYESLPQSASTRKLESSSETN